MVIDIKFRDFIKLHPLFPVVFLFSAAVSATSFYLRQYTIAYIEIGLGVLLSVIIIVAERRNFHDLKKTVSIINSNIVSSGDDRISSIPLPFIVCTARGGVIWYNKLFEAEVIGENELTPGQIKSFVPYEKIRKGLADGSFDMGYGGKRYTVYVSDIPGGENEEYILCFIDDTYYKDTEDKYRESRPAVMIASVDAMDEVSSGLSQNNFSALLGGVERLIISWFTEYKCILRKIGDGRFFVIAEYKIYRKMKEDNFGLLDSVREFKLEDVPSGLTVSVGIATGGDLAPCEAAARKSLDMAKGRGGDQVVINENGEYEFFGGVAAGVESRNQVQSRIVAGSVEELMRHSSGVFIMGHKNSDLDSVGSAIGLSEAVTHLGVDVKIVIDEKNTMASPLVDYYRKKRREDIFITPGKALALLNEDTLVIITDVMRPGFADSSELAEKAEKKVVIDHHRMSVDYISDSLIFYHEPNSSSASEMVTELIRYMPSKPTVSQEAAEALLAGIYLDTKNFTLKTGVRTFEAAAYLREKGADTITVRKLFAATAQENALISRIVNSAEIRGNYAFAKLDGNVPNARLAAAKSADSLLNIENVDASFVIFPSGNNDVSVSARSYGRINVQLIMEKLGGGGHQTMAAAQLKNTTTDNAARLLEEAVAAAEKRNTVRQNKKED